MPYGGGGIRGMGARGFLFNHHMGLNSHQFRGICGQQLS